MCIKKAAHIGLLFLLFWVGVFSFKDVIQVSHFFLGCIFTSKSSCCRSVAQHSRILWIVFPKSSTITSPQFSFSLIWHFIALLYLDCCIIDLHIYNSMVCSICQKKLEGLWRTLLHAHYTAYSYVTCNVMAFGRFAFTIRNAKPTKIHIKLKIACICI